MWNSKLPWQPIPVHTIPLEEDSLLTHHARCPEFERLLAQLMESDEVRAIDEENEWLYAQLTEHTGQNVTNMNLVNFVFDTLFIEQLYNKTLPDWTKDLFPDKMIGLRSLSFTLTTWNEQLARLRSGPILNNIVQVQTWIHYAINLFEISVKLFAKP